MVVLYLYLLFYFSCNQLWYNKKTIKVEKPFLCIEKNSTFARSQADVA
jgi:hypothetical protein